jgi:putative endopeptidase
MSLRLPSPRLAAALPFLLAAALLAGCATTGSPDAGGEAAEAAPGTAAEAMPTPEPPPVAAEAEAEPEPDAEPAGGPAAGPGSAADPLGELLASMDASADPCEDFYRYACGGWLETAKRPEDEARWVRSFSVIRRGNQETVRAILEDAAAAEGTSPAARRIGTYYASCMDEAAVEAAGTAPLAPYLERIAGVDGPESLMRVAGEMFRLGAGPLLGTAVYADFKNPETNVGFFYQGGIGMPDRDYYVSEDATKQQLMAAYEKHVARMLGLLGRDEATAAKQAAAVVGFETALAKVSRPAAELRDPETLYHKIDLEGLQALTPELPWKPFLAAAGHPDVTSINVATPEFFEGLQPAVLAADAETLRAYLAWQLLDATANLLPEPFVDANFEFFGKTLAGQQAIEPRWKRCVAATERALGEEVGKLYVERRFAGDSKQIALEMIGDIQGAFEAALPELSWMDAETRRRAVEKAQAVIDKIGYPDEWRDYSAVAVEPGAYFANAASARAYDFDYEMDKIGEPVDEKEWGMTPQMVNAYYNPTVNEIVFPAGILQPPFFNRAFPAPMNYGAIGAVIGHELTHGFDDSGRKFDAEGRLREWWEPQVAERFEERAQCVEELYSTYEVEPGVHVQGALTLGENIADIGGLKQAHAAYRRWEARHGAPELATDLTPEQVLFVAFGQVWCSKASKEVERLQVTTDSHSPARFRVIGPVSNNPAFAAAFDCPAGSPMAPAQRCEVW